MFPILLYLAATGLVEGAREPAPSTLAVQSASAWPATHTRVPQPVYQAAHLLELKVGWASWPMTPCRLLGNSSATRSPFLTPNAISAAAKVRAPKSPPHLPPGTPHSAQRRRRPPPVWRHRLLLDSGGAGFRQNVNGSAAWRRRKPGSSSKVLKVQCCPLWMCSALQRQSALDPDGSRPTWRHSRTRKDAYSMEADMQDPSHAPGRYLGCNSRSARSAQARSP